MDATSPTNQAAKHATLNGVMSLNNSLGTIEDFERNMLASP